MKSISLTMVTTLAILVGSCVDNEISLFIEHAKAQPEAPECSVSVSDDRSSGGTLDLAFGYGYSNTYQIQNQLMSREDYDNLVAETNGVFIDAYDVSITSADSNESLGISERLPTPRYIEPESTDIISAVVLTGAIAAEMANTAECLPISEENYPPSSMFNTATRYDANGREAGRWLGTVYTNVRFYAHSQGGKDLETQRFTFPISVCCGCMVDWSLCDDPCERYCTETKDFENDNMCIPGVANGGSTAVDCRRFYQNSGATWSGGCRDEDDEEVDCTCQSDICE